MSYPNYCRGCIGMTGLTHVSQSQDIFVGVSGADPTENAVAISKDSTRAEGSGRTMWNRSQEWVTLDILSESFNTKKDSDWLFDALFQVCRIEAESTGSREKNFVRIHYEQAHKRGVPLSLPHPQAVVDEALSRFVKSGFTVSTCPCGCMGSIIGWNKK